jgi:outer membrane protein assembly factor BamD
MYSKIFLFLGLVFFASCSKFSKLQKSDDLELKKQGAYNYYDKKDYFRASQLLEELVPLLKGTQDAEKAEFLYAMCQYEVRLLESAAFYFSYFLETYPRSIYAEESSYMEALSQFENSPSYYLDQGNTDKAIVALESFIQKYPESEKREKCQKMIDNLNDKLEKKAYENARLFHQIMEYKAAVITLGNFAKDYPNSESREDAMYYQILSEYKLAKVSTDLKKPERFQQTIDFYTTFVDSYPKSKKLKELESVYDYSTAQIALAKKLQNEKAKN